MPEIITIISPKGGSGASFCCAGLWSALMEKSHSVIAADACFEKNGLDYILGFSSDYVYTMSDVIEESCSLDEALCKRDLGSFIRFDYENNFFNVGMAMETLKNTDYEYVLIDANDRNEEFLNELLGYTDKLIFVTDPGELSVKHCEILAGKLEFENSYVIVNKIIPSYIHAGVNYTIDEILDAVSQAPIGLLPWSPEAEIIIKQGVKHGIEDKGLKCAFSNTADRICGVPAKAYDFKKTYDCFKLGRNFSVKGD